MATRSANGSPSGNGPDSYDSLQPSNDPIEEVRRQFMAHGLESVALGMAAVASVVQADQIFNIRADRILRPLGLSFTGYGILTFLSYAPSRRLAMGKLGENLQLHAATVTTGVQRLEKHGLVRRRPDPSDGRGTLAELTAKGQRVLSKAASQLSAELYSTLGVSDEELVQLVEILRKIREASGIRQFKSFA